MGPPPHHHHQQPPPGNSQRPPIPPLTSISPCIFIPIQGDELLLPFTPPSSRIDRLHAKINALNTNHKHVRANMLTLIRRECARLIQAAQAEEQAARVRGDTTALDDSACRPTEQELEIMVANMMAEPVGERPKLAPSTAGPPNFTNFKARSLREHWTTQIEITIGKGLRDLKGYDEHVAAIRKAYTDALDREVQSAMEIDN